jgi:hypothetical protein
MNRPSWWTQAHGDAWERAKEALHRDWDQTKHDLHLGGHELNQDIDHTVAQAAGQERLPAIDAANRPVVIGRWEDVDPAIGFGYAARAYYGSRHPTWSVALEMELQKDWKDASVPWQDVKNYVRHGYEARR